MPTTPYRFYKLSPGGNTTILVMDSADIAPEDRPAIATRLMDPLHIGGEQVGFVSSPQQGSYRLDMMGGEFCGNAARSLAAVLAFENRLDTTAGGTLTGRINVSGVRRPLAVSVSPNGQALDAAVEMPIHPGHDCISAPAHGMHICRMDGITHILLDETAHPYPDAPDQACQALRQELHLTDEDAVGCIWHTPGGTAIRPVVWVKATGTTHCETACGSGTVALALQQAAQACQASFTAAVTQPSAQVITATITSTPEAFQSAWIGGPVAIIAHGTTYL